MLLRKSRSYSEVYNDLSDEVVTLFRVLRSDRALELVEAVRRTPYSRVEFEGAYERNGDPVERARRMIVRSFMGFSTAGMNRPSQTGFRSNSNRSHTTPAHDWANYPPALAAIVARLAGVVVENRPAIEVLRQHDSASTLHYVDPPYVPGTRRENGAYDHEMDEAGHVALLEVLDRLEGAVALSGYQHPLYANRLAGWRAVERRALADGARPRREVLWLNRRCAQGLEARGLDLEGKAA